AAVVDADDEAVGRAALEEARGQAQLERQVRAAVGPQRPAVEPDLRAVVDRLEAHHPGEPARVGGQLEVLAVEADAAGEAVRRGILGVPRVRDGDPGPALRRRVALPALLAPLL